MAGCVGVVGGVGGELKSVRLCALLFFDMNVIAFFFFFFGVFLVVVFFFFFLLCVRFVLL